MQPLSELIGEKPGKARGVQPSSILLDKEERELLRLGEQVTQEQMWHLLENKRFQQLQDSAVNLQGDLLFNRRCPKCTLMPPCKHYQSQEELLADARNFVASDNFKSHLSPKKRQGLIMAVREQSQQYLHFNQSQMSSKQAIGDGREPWLINDPSMQGLNLNQDLPRNFRRNNNTLLADDGGFDTAP